jgi:uncharacterized protein
MAVSHGPAPDAAGLLRRLETVLAPRQRVLTAFSGGVDSTVVAAVARRALGRDNAPVAVGDSASLPRHELDAARQLADRLDLKLIEVNPGEQADPDYQRNAGDRCYHCKTHLYGTLQRLAAGLDIAYIANGAITDDLGDHRPGLVAAEEAQVIAPLIDAGFGKEQVRALAEHLGLPNAEKPAAACLASRIPYGTPVTAERLRQVEQAENVLREAGFTSFRVRHHEQVARIEVPWDQVTRLLAEEMRDRIIAGVKAAGFNYVSLDLEGFRSGSGNVVLQINGKGGSHGG